LNSPSSIDILLSIEQDTTTANHDIKSEIPTAATCQPTASSTQSKDCDASPNQTLDLGIVEGEAGMSKPDRRKDHCAVKFLVVSEMTLLLANAKNGAVRLLISATLRLILYAQVEKMTDATVLTVGKTNWRPLVIQYKWLVIWIPGSLISIYYEGCRVVQLYCDTICLSMKT